MVLPTFLVLRNRFVCLESFFTLTRPQGVQRQAVEGQLLKVNVKKAFDSSWWSCGKSTFNSEDHCLRSQCYAPYNHHISDYILPITARAMKTRRGTCSKEPEAL